MIYLAWKVLGALSRFRWWDKYASQKKLSLNFRFELWHLYKSLLPSVKGLSFTFMYLLSCKNHSYSLYSFLFFSFGKHHVVRKDLGIYVQLNMGSMSYYC